MATTTITIITEDVRGTAFGHVELWASEPVTNGVHQSAPPFHISRRIEQAPDGTSSYVMIEGMPQRAPDETWYYVLMVYPETNDCSKAGAMQYRFYIPEGAPASGFLTYFKDSYPAW